jgi:hypothetical protein
LFLKKVARQRNLRSVDPEERFSKAWQTKKNIDWAKLKFWRKQRYQERPSKYRSHPAGATHFEIRFFVSSIRQLLTIYANKRVFSAEFA